MHGSMGHIFFNMFSLVMFGSIIEQVLGSKRFLNFYFICGIGALVLQYGVQAYEVYNIAGTVRAAQFLHFDMLNNQVSSNLKVSEADFSTLTSIYGTPLVGASGAIYGLLLAFAYLFPNMSLYLFFYTCPYQSKDFYTYIDTHRDIFRFCRCWRFYCPFSTCRRRFIWLYLDKNMGHKERNLTYETK